MNERIKELALECYSPYSDFDHEKFAVLVAQDCANIADRYTQNGDWDISKMIKQHFGIEQ